MTQTANPPPALPARVLERRRAAALARHYRDVEHLKTREIARRLRRSPATVRAYLCDPDASRARRVKDSYRGRCHRCGQATSGSGPGQPRTICGRCNGAATLVWNRPRIEAALRAWHLQFGRPASTTDLSISYATRASRRDGGIRLRRLTHGWDGGRWPAPSVVQYHYGTLDNANRVALGGLKETPRTAPGVWDGKPHLPSQTHPNPPVSDGIRLIQKGAPRTSRSGPTET